MRTRCGRLVLGAVTCGLRRNRGGHDKRQQQLRGAARSVGRGIFRLETVLPHDRDDATGLGNEVDPRFHGGRLNLWCRGSWGNTGD